MYEIKKVIEQLNSGGSSNFLHPNLYKKVKVELKNIEYLKYYVYPNSDKVILYTRTLPNIKLYEILTYNNLRHQDILGSLFSLGISPDMFGDIVLTNNRYYVYIMDQISLYVKDNLTTIGNYKVKLKEVELNTLKNYKKEFIESQLIVSSLRIDTIISKIIGINREKVKTIIKSKEIMLNYEIVKNNSHKLNEGDIFSIKKYGKYKFLEVVKSTKKENYIIKYYKYV